MIDRVHRVLDAALGERVPRDHWQPDGEFRRRRLVVAATLVVGAALLGLSLATEPGDPQFYPLLLAVALTWTIGGLLSGPLHLGYRSSLGTLRRPVATPLLLGIAAGAVFLAGAAVVRWVPPLRELVADVLEHAEEGNLALVGLLALVNGAAEEVFFRGAVFATVGRHHPVLISTAVYALVTVATGNPMLVFAAVLMGTLFALQRRASGGILAPLITHLTWSALMVLSLPLVLAG